MSYEGWEQHICKNGHYYERNSCPSDQWDAEGDNSKCYICEEKSAWCNMVDCTNSSGEGMIGMDKMNQFLIKPEKYEVCNLGHSHKIEEAIFRIPTREDTDPLRTYTNEEDI